MIQLQIASVSAIMFDIIVFACSILTVCNSVCQPFGGQGACKAESPVTSDCCPFFLTNGDCTLSCPTNYEASNITDYTCG